MTDQTAEPIRYVHAEWRSGRRFFVSIVEAAFCVQLFARIARTTLTRDLPKLPSSSAVSLVLSRKLLSEIISITKSASHDTIDAQQKPKNSMSGTTEFDFPFHLIVFVVRIRFLGKVRP